MDWNELEKCLRSSILDEIEKNDIDELGTLLKMYDLIPREVRLESSNKTINSWGIATSLGSMSKECCEKYGDLVLKALLLSNESSQKVLYGALETLNEDLLNLLGEEVWESAQFEDLMSIGCMAESPQKETFIRCVLLMEKKIQNFSWSHMKAHLDAEERITWVEEAHNISKAIAESESFADDTPSNEAKRKKRI